MGNARVRDAGVSTEKNPFSKTEPVIISCNQLRKSNKDRTMDIRNEFQKGARFKARVNTDKQNESISQNRTVIISSNQIRKRNKDKTMDIKNEFQKGVDKVKNTGALEVADGLETFKGLEGMKPYFENSYGYVVFEKVGKVREI
jgi:hypothetical protein